jgi:hypothetical protein
MNYFLFAFLLCLQLKSFAQDDPVKKASWLVGTWKGMYNGAPFYETWRMQNDSLVNYTIEVKNNDTVVTRQTSLRSFGGKTIFGKKGDWLLKRITGNEIVLENDTSKYSNRIIYLHLANDHWFTILEHPGSTMYYDMEKIREFDLRIDRFIDKKYKRQ